MEDPCYKIQQGHHSCLYDLGVVGEGSECDPAR